MGSVSLSTLKANGLTLRGVEWLPVTVSEKAVRSLEIHRNCVNVHH